MSVPARTSSTSVSFDVRATEQIRRMRGGSQSHLMRCSDDNFYVVKFQNNPQGRRILFNELLGTRLMKLLGLPTTPCAVVKVAEALIDRTEDLVMELPRFRVPCTPGLQFGSRYFGNPHDRCAVENIQTGDLCRVEDLSVFFGMFVFDRWTCNGDARQCVFLEQADKYSLVGIDQGFCFNAFRWNFPDKLMLGLFRDTAVYRYVRTIEDFEPWLTRLEQLSFYSIQDAAYQIPPEWFEYDGIAMYRLLHRLNRRRRIVRHLILDSCGKMPIIFPKWEGERPGVVTMAGRVVA